MDSVQPLRFKAAKKEDADELCAVFESETMGGTLQLTRSRSPDYFSAVKAGFESSNVLAAFDPSSNRIVGTASIGAQKMWLKGEQQRIGYLSDFRFFREAVTPFDLIRGFQALRQLHEENDLSWYYTTIMDGNQRARNFLTKGAPGLPQYQRIGRYKTYLLPASERAQNSSRGNWTIQSVSRRDVPRLIQFINEVYSSRTLAPKIDADDLRENERFPGLNFNNFKVAKKDGEIIGSIGFWDQSDFERVRVHSYPFGLRLMKPLYNMYKRWKGQITLPDDGEPVRLLYAVFPAVHDGHPHVLRNLIDHIISHASDSFRALALGLVQPDPLQEVVKQMADRVLDSHLYAVSWDDSTPPVEDLRSNRLFVEASVL